MLLARRRQAGMDDQSVCKGSAGIHNTVGALGGSASKWGLGVFHSILGNDLHYEASKHFTRVPERVLVEDVLQPKTETWRHVTCRPRLPSPTLRHLHLQPKDSCNSPSLPPYVSPSSSPPSPWLSVIFTETGAKCFKRGDGNRPGGGWLEMRLSSENCNETESVLMRKCTKSDILLQHAGFQKLLEKPGKCVWDGDTETPV